MRKQREHFLTLFSATRSSEIPKLLENFIRFDNGQKNNEKIVLFGELEMLRVLEVSTLGCLTEFSKLLLNIFYQVQSIDVTLSGIAPACIYAFLSNKAEKYHRILETLKKLKPDTRPEKILLDFDQAAAQAFRKNLRSPICLNIFSTFSKFLRKVAEMIRKRYSYS